MANVEHLAKLMFGVSIWNQWRDEHGQISIDLSDCDLSDGDFGRANFHGVNLSGSRLVSANLSAADLRQANLFRANLNGADLTCARVGRARLTSADLSGSNLTETNLSRANMNRANLSTTRLSGTNFTGAQLVGAEFRNATIEGVILSDCNLEPVSGLEETIHIGPSYVSIDTIYRSEGKIPEKFLLGCGLPDSFITQIPSLVGALLPIQFLSCFISYNTKDDMFARRLHSRMRAEHLRVWFAPEDVQGGKKLHEQIEAAIQVHDRLLLILSENSVQSEWVKTEVRKARRIEAKENRRKLFPIRLCEYRTLRAWECIDAETGR